MKLSRKTQLIISYLIFTGAMALAQGQPGHHGPLENLTDDQKSCLKEKIGSPGEEPRPSHEKVMAAFRSCHITPPSLRPPPPDENRQAGSESSDDQRLPRRKFNGTQQ